MPKNFYLYSIWVTGRAGTLFLGLAIELIIDRMLLSKLTACCLLLVCFLDAGAFLSNCPDDSIFVSKAICPGDSAWIVDEFHTTAGTYYDSIPKAGGCDSIIITTLTVDAVIRAKSTINICEGDTAWVVDENQYKAGTYLDTISWPGGCIKIFETELVVDEFPTLEAAAEQDSVCAGVSVVLTATGADSYFWSPATYLNKTSGHSVMATPDDSITYRIIGANNACADTTTLHLAIEPCTEPVINNLFTPNGDGLNDFWVIGNAHLIDGCEVAVFDRWGKGIFKITNYSGDWDGTSNGKALPEGTYYYVISCSDKVYKGAITLLRFN